MSDCRELSDLAAVKITRKQSKDSKINSDSRKCQTLIFDQDRKTERPEWLLLANENITEKIHRPKIVKIYMFSFFTRLQFRLDEFPRNMVKLLLKGSTSLKLWLDAAMDKLPEKVSSIYSDFAAKFLKSGDWDSDIIINPRLDAASVLKVRIILDKIILEEIARTKFFFASNKIIKSALKKLSLDDDSKISNIKLDKRRSFSVRPIYPLLVDAYNRSSKHKKISSTSTIMTEVTKMPLFNPSLSEINEEYKIDTNYSVKVGSKGSQKLDDLFRKSKTSDDIDIGKVEHLYISRNIGIDHSFDLYRLLICFSGQISTKNSIVSRFLKGELIDVAIPTPESRRILAWKECKRSIMIKGINVMHPAGQINDLQTMTKSALFKTPKREKRYEFLKHLECHLGKNVDFDFLALNIPKNASVKQLEEYFKQREKQFEAYCGEKTSDEQCDSRPKSVLLTDIGKLIEIQSHNYAGIIPADQLIAKAGLFAISSQNISDPFAKFSNNLYVFFSKRELCKMEQFLKNHFGFLRVLQWLKQVMKIKAKMYKLDKHGFIKELNTTDLLAIWNKKW